MITTRLIISLLACVLVMTRDATCAGASPFDDAIAATRIMDAAQDPARSNRVAIVSIGYDALLLRVHLIRNAKHSIEIQTFIWTSDEVGHLVMYELIEAARRGVRVRVIADHMVSEKDPGTMAFLATVDPNLEIKHYRPSSSRLRASWFQTILSGIFSFHDINQRMHNKVMIVDDAVLITGGRNIENTYYDHSTGLNYRDRDVLAIGPVARNAAESFERYWNYKYSVGSRDLKDVGALIKSGKYPTYATREDFGFGSYFTDLDRQADSAEEITARFVSSMREVDQAHFVADEPGKKRGLPLSEQARLTRELKHTVESATNSVVIQTPYLIVSEKARKLLRKAKKDHPTLRIRVSSNSYASTDDNMAYSANYRLRGVYVEGIGMEVYEFKPHPAELLDVFPQYPAMKALAAKQKLSREPLLCVHAKSMVVDDRVAFVGSYNLDPRSENLNTEVGLLVEDAPFARALNAEISRDMSAGNSWVIGRRAMPLALDAVNGLIDGLIGMTPIDIWPIQNSCSFELLPGCTEVPPFDPAFHKNYREAGDFPGNDSLLSTKEITTRLYKAFGSVLTPIL
ncbi:MAG: phospholipase D family protein [bacterium]